MDVPNRRVLYGPFIDFPGENITHKFGQIAYNFMAQIEEWKEGSNQLKAWEDRANSHETRENSIGLVYDFPKVGSEHSPKTIVIVTSDQTSQIIAKTIHSYPNEDTIVFTKTEINL